MSTFNCLRVVGYEHAAVKRAERSEGYRKATEVQRKAYEGVPKL